MTQELPQKFLGKFKLGKSEHFDEYLAAKGVPWLVRKMIQFQSVTKVFEKSKQEGRYNMQNITSKESPIYENWALGESFEGRGLDGTQHKIKFDMVGDELTEEHFRLEDPNDKGDIYHYTVEGDQLVLKLQNESIVCRRFFKRIQ